MIGGGGVGGGEAQVVVTMSYCFANYEEEKKVTSGKQTIPEDYTFVPQAIPAVQMKKNLWPVCIACFTMNSMKPEKVSLIKLISSAGCVREYVTL